MDDDTQRLISEANVVLEGAMQHVATTKNWLVLQKLMDGQRALIEARNIAAPAPPIPDYSPDPSFGCDPPKT